MDPLSLVANVIAVLSAADSAARGVQRLAHIREAPEQVFQLQNEVSDARVIIVTVQETLRQRDEEAGDESVTQHIGRLIERAKILLSDITAVTEHGLIEYSEDTGVSKVTWRQWLKSHGKIEKLSTSLCAVRRDLASALVLLTAADIPSVRVSVRAISMETANFRDRLATLVSNSEATRSNSYSLQARDNRRSPPNTAFAAILPSSGISGNSQPSLRVQTSVHPRCKPLCACVCHIESTLNSPKWLGNIIGTLFLGYSGVPTTGSFSAKCTEISCRRNDSALIKVQYWFPSWFLHRMVVVRNQHSPLYGNQISVRTPRFLENYTEIFEAAQSINISMARLLLSQRKASPFDVAPGGGTPLHQAIKGAHTANGMELCKLLIREGADVEHKDMNNQSPWDQFWGFVLLDPASPFLMQLRDTFAAFGDLDENLRQRKFSSLHKIATQFSRADLEDHLSLSTAEIETKCTRGSTPLFWACYLGNISAIRSLIRFGADIETLNSNGHTIFHATVFSRVRVDAKVLEVLVGEIKSRELSNSDLARGDLMTSREVDMYITKRLNVLDSIKHTALSIATQKGQTDQVRLLLDLGANTETEGEDFFPIHAAIQFSCHQILELLLKREAKIDVTSHIDENILHFLASYGDFESISALYQHGICCIDTELQNIKGRTPLNDFEFGRSVVLTEDESTRVRCKEAFIQLLESAKTKTVTEGHDCWKDRRARREAERERPVADDGSSFSDDEFFDSGSIPDADVGLIEELGPDDVCVENVVQAAMSDGWYSVG